VGKEQIVVAGNEERNQHNAQQVCGLITAKKNQVA
jgi:hypothetical protein